MTDDFGLTPQAARAAGFGNWRAFANLVARGDLPDECYIVTPAGRRLFHLRRVAKWARTRRARRLAVSR